MTNMVGWIPVTETKNFLSVGSVVFASVGQDRNIMIMKYKGKGVFSAGVGAEYYPCEINGFIPITGKSHGRCIDADAFASEMENRQEEAHKWMKNAKDHDTAVRAAAIISFLSEVKLTLDKMPTIIIDEKELESNTEWDKQAFDLAISALEKQVGNDPIGIRVEGKDPYTEVADIIDGWCKKNYYSSALVTLLIDGRVTTEYLSFNGNDMNFEWETDWWEGEKEVVLIGFRMIDDVAFYGYPNYDC